MKKSQRFRRIAPIVFVVAALLTHGVVRAETAGLPEGTIQVAAGTGVWVDAPPTLPAGTRMMILEGHPGREGFFTIRLKLAAGARIQPHWHPSEERVTILSGVAKVGFGDSYDEAAMKTFEAGSFYLNPPKSHHYVGIVEDTEMQLTGNGPWRLHMLDASE